MSFLTEGPIVFLNTSIVTSPGNWTMSEPMSLQSIKEFVEAVKDRGFESAIGHEATASVMSKLLGMEIKVNRRDFIQKSRQIAIVFKMKSRAPEGKILTEEEMEKIGYDFFLLTKH